MEKLSFINKTGSQIASVFEDLALLRISVFKDFPYLYEGSMDYEKSYLDTYSRSERALLFAVYAGGKMVGATTCIPLSDETTEIKTPFEQQGYDIRTIFYFGESILLPEFRGVGLGHRFFDEREAHSQNFDCYKKACFLSVEREENHPAKPEGYRTNDPFWTRRGYSKNPALLVFLEWPDIGELKPTPKPLVCWMKDL